MDHSGPEIAIDESVVSDRYKFYVHKRLNATQQQEISSMSYMKSAVRDNFKLFLNKKALLRIEEEFSKLENTINANDKDLSQLEASFELIQDWIENMQEVLSDKNQKEVENLQNRLDKQVKKMWDFKPKQLDEERGMNAPNDKKREELEQTLQRLLRLRARYLEKRLKNLKDETNKKYLASQISTVKEKLKDPRKSGLEMTLNDIHTRLEDCLKKEEEEEKAKKEEQARKQGNVPEKGEDEKSSSKDKSVPKKEQAGIEDDAIKKGLGELEVVEGAAAKDSSSRETF